ncbi:MAG TPA: PH domain-containing protein [Methylomirabilota bacterium]|nr:PH domain-containing protein [Methylomirabilota bacterium]
MTYRLASMSPSILALTLFLLVLPVVFVVFALYSAPFVLIPAGFLLLIYAWIWLWFRPSKFAIRADVVEIVWPLRRLEIARRSISSVRLIDRAALRREVGRSMRVGAGGLGGGFGWLWTTRRGLVRMYVSRLDGFVWIERGAEQPWLITPDRPDAFVQALAPRG